MKGRVYLNDIPGCIMEKAFLILEDGSVYEGKAYGARKEVISEIVFNTSMTGYLEVLTDPSYAGQAVIMTYPLIGNYGICLEDMESERAWPDAFIAREFARMPSNFRCDMGIEEFLLKYDIPGIEGLDTRALTKKLRECGTMNGLITTNENFNLDEILPKLKEYKPTGDVYSRFKLRYREIKQSAQFIDDLLEELKEYEDDLRVEDNNLIEHSFAISITEGWRGEIVHIAITGTNGDLIRYKIKDASFNNWYALAMAVRNNGISDFPLCNKSFNLSYCACDL